MNEGQEGIIKINLKTSQGKHWRIKTIKLPSAENLGNRFLIPFALVMCP